MGYSKSQNYAKNTFFIKKALFSTCQTFGSRGILSYVLTHNVLHDLHRWTSWNFSASSSAFIINNSVLQLEHGPLMDRQEDWLSILRTVTNCQVECVASTTYSPGRTFSKVKLPPVAVVAFLIVSGDPFFFRVKVTPKGPSVLPWLITC